MNDALHLIGIDLSHAVAVVLIVFFAAGRFNTPRSARSQTSLLQYWGSCGAYTVACLGLLMILIWLFGHNPRALALLHTGSSVAIPPELETLDKPLVAALVLTAVLPSFPWLSEIDTRLLRFFHRLGSIPFGAGRWAQQMEAAAFVAPAELLARMKAFIENSPALPASLIAELHAEPEMDRAPYRFTRNLGLYVTISDLPIRGRFADDYQDDMAAFEKRIAGFFAQSVGFFSLRSQIAREASASGPSALHNAQEAFNSAALEVYADLRLMLARILLYGCRGEGEVARRLREIGFDVKRPPTVRIPGNLLMADLLGVVLIFIGMALFTSYTSKGLSLTGALILGLQVAIGHCIAATFALLPKQIFGFADIRCSGERPILWYVIFAAVSALCTVPVMFVFYQVRVHFLAGTAAPTLSFAQQSKWLLMPAMMSFALAFACDDCAASEKEPRWLSMAEGAGVALLLSATGLFVVLWLQDIPGKPASGMPPTRYLAPLLIGAAMGALFGGTVPKWYRRLRRDLLKAPVRQESVAVRAPDSGREAEKAIRSATSGALAFGTRKAPITTIPNNDGILATTTTST